MTTEVVKKELPKDPTLVAALATVEKAQALTITTPEESRVAQEFALEIARVYKAAEAILQPPVTAANAHADEVRAHRDKYLKPLAAAKETTAKRIGAYLAEEQRKAAEEARKAQQKALEEQLARQKAEAEAAAARAQVLDKAGLKEDAAAAMEEAVAIEQAAPAPVYVPPAPVAKEKGVGLGEDWKFRITDKKQVPEEYKDVNEVTVGKVVRALKGATNIPGIEVYSVPRVSLRSA